MTDRWRKITDNPPKDGSGIMLGWEEDLSLPSWGDSEPGYWESRPNHWDETGWQLEDARDGLYVSRHPVEPTHWQPYPDPPGTTDQELNAVYNERNQLVALLARLFPSGTKRTDIKGWDPEWHGCVYIDLPTGQASWHFHDSEACLFEDLPLYDGEWDGHDIEEKYRRVRMLGLAAFAYREDPAKVAKALSELEKIRNESA